VIARLPVVDRALVQRERARLTSTVRPADWWRTTGGSTSQPVQLPAWSAERRATAPDMWLARSWYGVTPADRLFMLWGHSHLLGAGWAGWKNRLRRQVSDRLLGYRRFSAYNLEDARMRQAATELLRFRPDYVLGYSVALDAFARANRARASELRGLGLKVIVATAEAFPFDDSAALVAEVFGAPVAMEYGTVETDAIAHTMPVTAAPALSMGDYAVLWRSYVVEALERGPRGGYVLRVTSLYPRAFPLIRYELGDEGELEPHAAGAAAGLERFRRLLGRSNDFVQLDDGSRIHSEAITHCVRGVEHVTGYQLLQSQSRLVLRLTVSAPLDDEALRALHQRFVRVHPAFASLRVEIADRLEQTIAGKTPMVIRR
jgi:phenylacetate-CoA ligase